MREIVIGNVYYEYAMYIDEKGHLCHWYFLPKNTDRKPEKRCMNVMYPYEVSLAVDALNLWIDKTASENDLNIELLNAEKERLK